MVRPDALRFSHTDGRERNPAKHSSSTTRYLSGAAYVDEIYAQQVIDELVTSSHRAVAPSLGFDVTTVVRHCFRAQRLWLIQNAVLTAILVVGAVFFTSATVTIFAICLLAAVVLPEAPKAKRWPTWKVVTAVVVLLLGAGCLVGPLMSILTMLSSDPFGSSGLDSGSFGPLESATGDAGAGQVAKFLGGFVLVGAALFTTLVWSRHRMITTITSSLRSGHIDGRIRPLQREVEQRIRVIDTAQHGNIILHAGYEPFVGAGERVDAWSIATELRPDDDPVPGDGSNGASRTGKLIKRAEIDPVELVTYLRQRLAALRSHDLPQQERISGLQLRDLVISSGTRWHDYPLIDDAVRMPYAFAEPDAIEAIIRYPQTGARHFLRASVGAPDKAALGSDGRAVMPAEHQSVVTSTYLHVAVEGGMLYVELVAAVLGPLQQQYLDIDRYDGSTDALTAAAGEAVRRFVRATGTAPLRLIRSLVRTVSLTGAIHRSDREAFEEPVYDFGARSDIRELASIKLYANYLQRLDAEKYRRLIDRRATEAIYEFLTAKGIDTSDFAAKVNFNQYNNTTIGGSAYGPVATGTAASASMFSAAVTGKKAGKA